MSLRWLSVAAVSLVTTVLLGAAAFSDARPTISGDLSALFPTASIRTKHFREVERYFGSRIVDAFTVRVPAELDDQTREALYQLESNLGELSGVLRVWSPLLAYGSLRPPFTLRAKGAARFLIEIEQDLNDSERHELNSRLNELVARYPELRIARAGPFFVSEEVSNAVRSENSYRVPLCIALLTLILFFLYRCWTTTILILATPGLAIFWLLLAAALLGLKLNPITQLVPPLLLAVGGAYGVHVASRLRVSTEHDYSVVKAELRKAIGIAAITTASGFLSLYSIHIAAVEEFAVLSSIGVLFCAFLSLYILPSVLPVSSRVEENSASVLTRVRKGPVAAAVIVFTLLCGTGIWELRTHVDPLDFLPKDNPARVSIERAEKSFPGNHLLSVLFTTQEQRALEEDDFQLLAKIAERFAQLDEVVSAVSWQDFTEIEAARSEFALSTSPKYGSDLTTTASLSASRILLESSLEGADLLRLVTSLEETLDEDFASLGAERLRVVFSSIELLMAEQSQIIVRGISKSLIVTLLIVALLLLALFRNFQLMLVGLVPNLVPLVLVFGLLGHLYGEVNFGAALVATAALSIAVDNTFHLIVSWTARGAIREDIEAALQGCLPAFQTTAMVLFAGFSVLAFSQTIPIQQFGLLLCCTLLVGLFADITVLPLLLRHISRQPYEKRDQ